MQWDGKPYHSLDYEMKRRFGEKVYRLALNGGMTCPNRDGTLGRRGCIFCSAGGSGDFAASPQLSVSAQIREQKAMLRQKRPVHKFIAYFQAYTNTYAPVNYLERIFMEAVSDPEVAVLSIATRPDCLPPDVLQLLEQLNQIKPVWVELGLQTIHETSARLIRRGYSLDCFEQSVDALRTRNIEIIVHTILGLPGEARGQMLQTIEWLNRCDIQGIKLQLLHILRGTDLGALYESRRTGGLCQDRQNEKPDEIRRAECPLENRRAGSLCEDRQNEKPDEIRRAGSPLENRQAGNLCEDRQNEKLDEIRRAECRPDAAADFSDFPPVRPLEMEEYISLIVDCVERLDPRIVIHRLTGDGPHHLLLAPLWSARKRTVLNAIHKAFQTRGAWQGRCLPGLPDSRV